MFWRFPVAVLEIGPDFEDNADPSAVGTLHRRQRPGQVYDDGTAGNND